MHGTEYNGMSSDHGGGFVTGLLCGAALGAAIGFAARAAVGRGNAPHAGRFGGTPA